MADPAPVLELPLRVAETPTLRAFALAAVAAQLPGAGAEEGAEKHFLLHQQEVTGGGGAPWFLGLVGYFDRPATPDRPLLQLARSLDLSPLEIVAVALAAGVEDDLMVGRALAWIQAPIGGSRPTVSLLARCLAPLVPPGARAVELLMSGAAVGCGLLQLLGEGLPLPERAVAVPLHLALALSGCDAEVAGTTVGLAGTAAIPLPASTRTEAARHARALADGTGRLLTVRTGSPAEGRAVLAAVAAEMALRPAFIQDTPPAGLGPWLLSRGLLPVYCVEAAPGERRALAPIPGYPGPVAVLCGPDGTVELGGGTGLTWLLGIPARAERRELWARSLGDDALAERMAREHRHGSGRIAQLGALARHRAALDARAAPTDDDLSAAARNGAGAGMESLAQPLPQPVEDRALVATPTLRADLQTLLLRCRMRDGLTEGLGASAIVRYSPGVRALFVGPSGTGKTLASGWLASRLGLPLFRVDLAAITSKYIGETEKNLALLLARAEQAEVVLLFDEADSLFGKRTEVRDANDRFANAQTNYLLQRIESFEGIVLLTSNTRSRFDSAFARRLDMIIDFPTPGPEERRALWESHLGARHRLKPAELNRLAATVELAGGHIRNAVLAAAVQARHADRPITLPDLVAGVAIEYRKLGKQMPVALQAGR